jgi:Ca-activated chloride channel family protein
VRQFAVVAFFVLSALVPVRQDRDGGQVTVATSVDLVVFNVTVTDSRGRHVSGLQQTDFRVREDKQAQDIGLFRSDDVPASVGLIIDNSSSMHNKRAEVVEAALAFVGASNRGDELFVLHFNETIRMGLPPEIPFSSDPGVIRAALLLTDSNGMTALYDALAAGIERVKAGTQERKALVVLSDGGDNASQHGLDDVLKMAQQSSATIYTIGIYDETDRDKNPGALKKIAALSGGRAYFPASLGGLDRVWHDVADGIRGLYTIGYYSSNHRKDGAFRRVEITAGPRGGKGLRVATRSGYRGPVAKSHAP